MSKAKYGVVCCAKHCANKTYNCNLSFFGFPKDRARAEIWLSACGRDDLKEKSNKLSSYKLCAAHFEDKMYANDLKNRLLPKAMPTIFSSGVGLPNRYAFVDCRSVENVINESKDLIVKMDPDGNIPTETDAFNYTNDARSVQSGRSALTNVDPLSDYYNMNHHRRGNAIIFSHVVFDGDLLKREGATKDAKDLEEVLKELKFDVEIYNDLKYGAIYDVISTLSKSDYSDVDCLLIAVMTHGDYGKIYARDHQYPPDFLWKSFSGDNCPSLAGKPKLFFVQACRGDEIDDGVRIRVRTQSDGQGNHYTIPVMADILVMYSCYDGYLSWRSVHNGSWFIQSLCEELKLRSKDTDLLTLLTFLNRRMAVNCASVSPNNREMHGKKQIGTIVSTLTRLLYFYPQK